MGKMNIAGGAEAIRLLPVFAQGEGVLAAVSGGADSVCLVRLLVQLRNAGRIRLYAAHLNHGIRGADADDDQAFVEELCRELDVPLRVARSDVPALAKASGKGLETQARETRRSFLMEAMEEFGAEVIATGHHAQDQAETVLMHLLRGGGLRGAGGLRAREGVFARPLLATDKADILSYLAEIRQPYRRDDTNFIPDNPRNALRLEIFPRLETLYPGCEGALGRFARVAAQEDEVLSGESEAFLKAHARAYPFGWALAAARVHPALARRALMRFAGVSDFETAERLTKLYFSPRGAMTLGSVRYERAGGALYRIEREAPALEAPLADGARLAGLGALRMTIWLGGPIKDDPFVQAVDAAALQGAVLRTRRAGDRMRKLGAPGEKRLSDILIDHKVPRPLRGCVPLIARGDRVLWAVGVCLSQEAAITDDTANKIRLEWKREDTP